MKHLYFDWASTSPIDPDVLERQRKVSEQYPGNPSSAHRLGKEASELLQELRSSCAGFLGCRDDQLVFTSGGSESNSLILSSFLWKRGRGSVVIPAAEHPSVYEYHEFFRELGFHVIQPDAPGGHITPEIMEQSLQHDTVLVCFSMVNNVSGALAPVNDLARVIRSFEARNGRKIHIHTDAVQALGKLPVTLSSLDIDSASFSAHKIAGPRGTGALYLRKALQPLSRGGGQEFSLRPGTENLAGIAGFSTAIAKAVEYQEQARSHAENLRSVFLDCLDGSSPVSWLGKREELARYSPFIMLCSAAPVPSEVFLRVLSDRGIYLSAGSACSSKTSEKRERVLTSMGFSSSISNGVLRISFAGETAEDDVRLLADIMREEAQKLRNVLTK